MFFIYITVFINLVGFGMVFPLLPFYAKQFEANDATIGLLASSFAIAQFLFSPLWGRFSDRFGRKPIISLGLLGLSLAFFLFALAQNLSWLFISRFLQGFFAAATMPVAHAYVADITGKQERIKGMSRLGASAALGFIFGPAIGGVLSSGFFQLPFFLAAFVAIFNFLLVSVFLQESLNKRSTRLFIFEGFLNILQMWHGLKGNLSPLFILAFLWSFGISNNQVAVPLLGLEKLNIDSYTIGIFFSFMGAVAALSQWFLTPVVAKKLGEWKTAILGLVLMALSLFLMPFSIYGVALASLMMMLAFGSSLSRPSINTLISKHTLNQGEAFGIANSFESMGRILGPLLGGILFFEFGYHAPFAVVGVAIIFMLILLKSKQIT